MSIACALFENNITSDPDDYAASNNGEKPINLFQLGCLFVIRASYWSCRIGNEPQDFHLSPHEVERSCRHWRGRSALST